MGDNDNLEQRLKDIEEKTRKLVEKHGSPEAVIGVLLSDNYTLREDRRQLKEKVEGLEKSVPAEGSLTLTAEQKAVWEAYQALGKPDEVKGKLDAAETATAELATERRRGTIRDAAGLLGYKATVLEDRLERNPNLVLEITGEGDKRQAVVKDGDKATPLKEYAEGQWADYLPALAASTQQQQRFHEVHDTGNAPKTGEAMVEATVAANKARAEAPNALRPAPVTA